jgi:hypothetical protein
MFLARSLVAAGGVSLAGDQKEAFGGAVFFEGGEANAAAAPAQSQS